MRGGFFLLFCLLFGLSCARADGLGEGFGLQVKENVTQDELARIREAGFGFVRVALYWDVIERTKGAYTWDVYDRLIGAARAKGLGVLVTVTSGNAVYDGRVRAPRGNIDQARWRTRAPSSAESIDAFARFAAAAAARYNAPDMRWEIWNEPDYRRFWAPEPNAAHYAALAARVCELIKTVAPQAFVIGPALGAVPEEGVSAFLQKLWNSRVEACLDAISLHPYRPRGQDPEGAMEAYAAVTRQMIYARQTKPLVNSEWGFSDVWVGREAQADYVLRTRLIDMMRGVGFSVWYEWKDSKPPSDNPESGYGLTDYRGQEKPALTTVRAVLPNLYKARFDRRLFTGAQGQFVLLVRAPDGSAAALGWRGIQAAAPVCLVVDGQKRDVLLDSRTKILARGREIKICEAISRQPNAR